jgi:hypothetical protein
VSEAKSNLSGRGWSTQRYKVPRLNCVHVTLARLTDALQRYDFMMHGRCHRISNPDRGLWERWFLYAESTYSNPDVFSEVSTAAH